MELMVALKSPAQRIAERRAREIAERRERERMARDEAERTRVPDRIKPTLATVRHLRLQPDPIRTLHDRGTITDRQRDAALEIGDAYSEAVFGAMTTTAKYNGMPGGTGFGRTPEPTAPEIARRARYRRWADTLSARVPDALVVAIDVIVDGRSLRQVDAERRWRNGRASDLLVDALRVYAILAGWEQAPTPGG